MMRCSGSNSQFLLLLYIYISKNSKMPANNTKTSFSPRDKHGAEEGAGNTIGTINASTLFFSVPIPSTQYPSNFPHLP